MSPSEGEAKQQIAQAREALQSIKASSRMGSLVRILGVIVGLVIVGVYVMLFLGLGKSVFRSSELQDELARRVNELKLQQKTMEVLQGSAPVVLAELQNLAEETQFQNAILEQAEAFVQEARPIAEAQMARVRPRLLTVLEAEMAKTNLALEEDLRKLLQQRLRAIIKQQTDQLQQEVDLTEEQVEDLLVMVVEANREALLNVVQKRWKRNDQKLQQIADLVAEFPDLPENMPEQEIIDQTVRVLVALLKESLPEYEFEPRLEIKSSGAD